MRKSNLYLWIVMCIGIVLLSSLTACNLTPTAIPTPTMTPGPSPTPPSYKPVSYHAPNFGVVNPSFYDVLRVVDAEGRSLDQYSVDVGASWNRLDFHWSWIRKEVDGNLGWYWNGTDHDGPYSYDEAVRTTSLTLIGILDGGIPTDPVILGDNPYQLNGSWEAFVTQVVSRYGDKISAWEIGNETGLYDPLSTGQYLDALATACHVIGELQGHENATVILGSPDDQVGLSLANDANEYPGLSADYTASYKDILEGIKDNTSIRECVDVIGLHPYYLPAWSWWTVTGVDMYLKDTLGWDSPPQYWITESGIQHNDNVDCDPTAKGPCVSDFVQASYVIQQYVMATQAFSEVHPDSSASVVIHHRIRDNGSVETFGLLNDNNFRLPSYYAAWLVTQVLGEATYGFDGTSDLSGSGYNFSFR